jgi:site-specific DNA-cytosine methylase
MTKPLCIDLFCGLGGWAEGFLAEGYDVIGFDIERRPYPGQLVLQDVCTVHGAQLVRADALVASSPCQQFSYQAMPWKRAKALGPPLLGIK